MMNSVLWRLLLGASASIIIAGVAYWRQSLSLSGVFGAVLLGTAVFGFGGWVWGGTLVAFFVSSSLLTQYRVRQKSALAAKFAKGSQRDLGQTLANGGLAGLIALGVGIVGKAAAYYPALAFAFYGALATVTADTWATEIGVLAAHAPRLITTGRRVPAGSSGGVTRRGLLAALAGAMFIGLAVFVLVQGAALATSGMWLLSDWIVIPVAVVGGFAGATFDSLLGASVQVIYYCEFCETETERPVHPCGHEVRHLRGWRWLNNDGVNFAASVIGALVAALVGLTLL